MIPAVEQNLSGPSAVVKQKSYIARLVITLKAAQNAILHQFEENADPKRTIDT